MGPIATAAGYYTGQYIGKRIGKSVGGLFGKKGKKIGKNTLGFVAGAYGAAGANLVPILGQFCKGGLCKKTGAYILHKGEYVVSVKNKKKCNLCKKKGK